MMKYVLLAIFLASFITCRMSMMETVFNECRVDLNDQNLDYIDLLLQEGPSWL